MNIREKFLVDLCPCEAQLEHSYDKCPQQGLHLTNFSPKKRTELLQKNPNAEHDAYYGLVVTGEGILARLKLTF